MNTIHTEEIKPYTFLSDKYKPLLEDLFEKVKQGPFRPKYHIVPPSGLLNDPNGLSYFNGKYHIFYQWYPFGARHDMKHWNHISTEDLINFDEEREILIPDKSYEKNGCYSGNAYVDEENNQCYLFYTANFKDKNGIKVPMQALAIMNEDGSIDKYRNSPIIEGSPEGIGHNIRDPFVFKKEGSFYMFLGAETVDLKGALLLYKSKNLTDWEYAGQVKVLLNGKELNLGTFVECPGIIEVDSKEILFLSLIGSDIEGTVKENRFTTIALIGELDLKSLEFKAENMEIPDYGFDYYAPQPFYGKDKTPLLYAWFGCGDQNLPEDKFGWRHGLTFPREIKLEGNKLITPSYPVLKESFREIEINNQDPDIFNSLDEAIRIVWNLKNDKKTHTLKVGTYDNYWSLTIDFKDNQATVKRDKLRIKVDPDYGLFRSAPFEEGEELKVEIFLDNSFNEVYLNEGESVLSFRSYEQTEL